MKEKIKYPYLPTGREIKYVGPANKFMQEAYKMARDHSTDRKHSTGAVVVKDGKIIGGAGNQVPIKNKWFQKYHSKGIFCVRKWFGIPSGKHYWLCPGCSKYSDHAEQGAVKNAQKQGYDTTGADLYLWGHWWACEPCWNKMLEGGIKNVYLRDGSENLFNRDSKTNILGWKEDHV